MCKGTSLLQKGEKRSQVHMESTVGTGRRAEVCLGLTLLKSRRICYLSEEAFEPLSHVCLGRVMCTQGTIETTNNNGSTKWLALIKSRLLWLYLSTVITRNSVMRGFFFIFHLHRIPCISINILLWSPRYLQIRWCCFSLVGGFSVLI